VSKTFFAFVVALIASLGPWAQARTEQAHIAVLVPITGFLSLEGTSQRNGAVLALEEASPDLNLGYSVQDTATAPEGAVKALERALADNHVVAVAASIFGPQMLAMIPIADRAGVPLVTISGTAKITELGSPWVFRFFPGDVVAKVAQVDFAVERLGVRKPALIYQTTAYGQSGARHIRENLIRRGLSPVLEEGLDVAVKDMLPVLAKARAAGADSLLIHLHAGPTALLVRAAAAMGLDLPIVAGSAMHQPSTAALVEPPDLQGVCAETASSPVSGGAPEIEDWLARYRAAFGTEPDAFAVAQYDGVKMVLAALEAGARNADEVAAYLSNARYDGLAMSYRSDGKGNMAHGAIIVCYDGTSRVPRIEARYENVTGALD